LYGGSNPPGASTKPSLFFRGLIGYSKCLLIIKTNEMFGLFKKKSEKEKLQKRYERLLKESYELSKTNRKESDKKAYEADLIAKEIDALV
jgi:hypothetical protein